MYFAAILAVLPAAAWALQIQSPAKGSVWSASESQTVRFSAVSTDPKLVDVVLVNMNTYPTVSTTIGENVDTSTGSFVVTPSMMAGLSTLDGYQVNFVSRDNNGILAQSGTFEIEASGQTDDTPVTVTAGATSRTTGSSNQPATVTVTPGGSTLTRSTTSGTATRSRTTSGTGTVDGTATESPSSTTSTPNAAPFSGLDKGGVLAAALGLLAAVV